MYDVSFLILYIYFFIGLLTSILTFYINFYKNSHYIWIISPHNMSKPFWSIFLHEFLHFPLCNHFLFYSLWPLITLHVNFSIFNSTTLISVPFFCFLTNSHTPIHTSLMISLLFYKFYLSILLKSSYAKHLRSNVSLHFILFFMFFSRYIYT